MSRKFTIKYLQSKPPYAPNPTSYWVMLVGLGAVYVLVRRLNYAINFNDMDT